jgi:mannose-6-phosphate isomerase-like protein (cupin superfamily)
MKKFAIVLASLLASQQLFADEDDAVIHWSNADLDAFTTMLSAQAQESRSAVADRIVDFDHYFAAVVHRESGSSLYEAHAEWADLYVVSSGRATLTVGGTITEPTEVSPGEIRGTGIVDGEDKVLTEGDIVLIPANTAHYVSVEEGDHITYFIFKVRNP